MTETATGGPSPRFWHRIRAARTTLSAVLAFGLCVSVYGTIPFLSVSVLGQMLWISGFAQSFANGPWYSIHALDFGLPASTPIAFGLSGAWLESILLRLTSLSAVDAYATMIWIYLAAALAGAIAFARRLGLSGVPGVLVGTVWICLPMVWIHSGYSMLSLGFALLPAYILSGVSLVDASHESMARFIASVAVFMPTCLLACFMDGYTFMMLVVGCGFYWVYDLARFGRPLRIRAAAISLALLVSGLGCSAWLYTRYLGVSHFDHQSMDIFRAFGVSPSMLMLPTKGVIALLDEIHMSMPRGEGVLYGDASVWNATFVLPLALSAAAGFLLDRNRRWCGFFVGLALFGLWMGLGPSLKIHALRPAGDDALTMASDLAPIPTGSGLISSLLPGFDTMRSSYRWIALCCVGLWGLTILWLVQAQRQRPWLAFGVPIALLLTTCLPNPYWRVMGGMAVRDQFFALERDFAHPLQEALAGDKKVAFLPRGNDFMVNYLSAFASYDTPNVGGDKNVALAAAHWDKLFLDLDAAVSKRDLSRGIRRLLAQGTVDAVVVPYVDMLWDAHTWPPTPAVSEGRRLDYASSLACIAADPAFHVTGQPLFSVVVLSERGHEAAMRHDQPAFDAGMVDCPAGKSIHWPAGQESGFLSIVGKRDEVTKALSSDGRKGYLLYGPYTLLPSGHYMLEVFGSVASGTPPVVDVTAGNTLRMLGTYTIVPAVGAGVDTPLLHVPIDIPPGVSDIQTRVFVEANTQFTMTRLELDPVTITTPAGPAGGR